MSDVRRKKKYGKVVPEAVWNWVEANFEPPRESLADTTFDLTSFRFSGLDNLYYNGTRWFMHPVWGGAHSFSKLSAPVHDTDVMVAEMKGAQARLTRFSDLSEYSAPAPCQHVLSGTAYEEYSFWNCMKRIQYSETAKSCANWSLRNYLHDQGNNNFRHVWRRAWGCAFYEWELVLQCGSKTGYRKNIEGKAFTMTIRALHLDRFMPPYKRAAWTLVLRIPDTMKRCNTVITPQASFSIPAHDIPEFCATFVTKAFLEHVFTVAFAKDDVSKSVLGFRNRMTIQEILCVLFKCAVRSAKYHNKRNPKANGCLGKVSFGIRPDGAGEFRAEGHCKEIYIFDNGGLANALATSSAKNINRIFV